MQLEHCALTDVGRLRANNEDDVRVDAVHGVAVLADGMGGCNAGEVANALAVDLIAGDGDLRGQRQPRHLRGRQHPRSLRRHGHHPGDGPRGRLAWPDHAAGGRAFRLRSLVTRALCVEDTVLLDMQSAISSGCVPKA